MAASVCARDPLRERRHKMEALETYTSALAVLSALLLVAAGRAKKHLVWKRAKAVPVRRRRRRF
jgi:hypothetical protein